MGEDIDAAAPVGVTMRHTSPRGIPALPLLNTPLVVRRARKEEAEALAALLGSAFPAETWETEGTERELFDDESVRATLVVSAEDSLLATASLQIHPDALECGWVRWVATDINRRREGLARVLVIAALAYARQAGCRDTRLNTETDRLAAISLYLQLGFEPFVRDDKERMLWEQVITRLRGQADPMLT